MPNKMKKVKAYSLDIDVIKWLEKQCKKKTIKSQSTFVNSILRDASGLDKK